MAEKANNYARYVREMYAPANHSDEQRLDTKENNFRNEEPEVVGIINPRRVTIN